MEVTITHIEPDITDEENQRRLQRVLEIVQMIADEEGQRAE